MIRRRTLLQGSLAAGAFFATGCASSRGRRAPGASASPEPEPEPAPAPPPEPRRLLILGGTGFLGPPMVEIARQRGHTVTLFNRGKTNPGLFPDVEKLQGDRDGNLTALEGRGWDAVVDTSGYVPRVVRASAELLAPSVEQYVFISSISVYSEERRPGMDERQSPLAAMPPGEEKSEDVPRHYGALKAASEKAAEEAMPGRTTTVRPGLIVGPGDPTDRFTYWPVRMDRGGEALAPGDGSDPVQVIDVRDLAAWLVLVVEEKHLGVFNGVGPEIPMRDLVGACVAAASDPARPVWVPASFLAEQGVAPWRDMPAWVPRGGDLQAFASVPPAAAIARGLTLRPIADTARDTLAWWKTLPEERRASPRAGLAPEREKEVLAAWKASGGR
jgi:2'-hydroxyisoflavone reductase